MARGGTNASQAFIAGSDLDAVYLAPLGTPLPTTIDGDPSDEWEHVGWLHSDGLTETAVGSKTEIRGHQGNRIVRTRMETPGTQFSFTALESKRQTNELRYVELESEVVDGVRKTRRTPGQKVSARAAVIDVFDADYTERKKRKVIPHVDVTPNGDIVWAGTDIAGYPFMVDIISDYDVFETLNEDETPPALASVSPTSAAAGATVTLTGTGFLGATQVRFGSANATSFNIVSNTSITAVVPAGTAGSAAVKVIKGSTESSTVPFTRS